MVILFPLLRAKEMAFLVSNSRDYCPFYTLIGKISSYRIVLEIYKWVIIKLVGLNDKNVDPGTIRNTIYIEFKVHVIITILGIVCLIVMLSLEPKRLTASKYERARLIKKITASRLRSFAPNVCECTGITSMNVQAVPGWQRPLHIRTASAHTLAPRATLSHVLLHDRTSL